MSSPCAGDTSATTVVATPLWGVCIIGAGGSVRRPAAASKLCGGYSNCILQFAKLHPLQVSILLPRTSQIILDKVVVLDKGTASVNAPPPLHRKITISSRLSVTHTAMKKKPSTISYRLSAILLLSIIGYLFAVASATADQLSAVSAGDKHWRPSASCR